MTAQVLHNITYEDFQILVAQYGGEDTAVLQRVNRITMIPNQTDYLVRTVIAGMFLPQHSITVRTVVA